MILCKNKFVCGTAKIEVKKKSKKMMSSSTKKEDPSACQGDSGFHSGFQESCELQPSDDNKAEMSEGNSQRSDKEKFDSGVFHTAASQMPVSTVCERRLYVPAHREEGFQFRTHPSIYQLFDQDEYGYTKLHLAILSKLERAILTLITLVPDSSFLNIRDGYGQTALHLAVAGGQQKTVRSLIDAGADINIRDNRCNTALHLACLNKDSECALTILSAVESLKDQKLLANLEHWNYEGETCFYISCKARNLNLMSTLVKCGANVNAREGRSGFTALHKAVETKSEEVIRFLTEECHSLNIDTENYACLTAFQLALLTEQEDIANYLMEKGATPYFTASDSDDDMDSDDSSDLSSDDLESNHLISQIATIAVCN